MNYLISDHATDRFDERFGYLDVSIKKLLEDSILFGGQKGKQYYLLNTEYDTVFPIIIDDNGNHIVKSVLTIQQAKANIALFNKNLIFKIEIPKPIQISTQKIISEKERKIISEKERKIINEKEREENNNKLKCMAQEHITKYGKSYPSIEDRKSLIKKIKSKLPVSNRQIDKFFMLEIARIIREDK